LILGSDAWHEKTAGCWLLTDFFGGFCWGNFGKSWSISTWNGGNRGGNMENLNFEWTISTLNGKDIGNTLDHGKSGMIMCT